MYKNYFSKKPQKFEKITDTSSILTEQDLKEIDAIESIKKALFSYIDKEKLLKRIIDIIDESEFIDFKNARSRKFIDLKRPSFNLILNKEKILNDKKYNPTNIESFSNEKEEIEFLSNIVYSEIINKVTDYINDNIHKNKDFEDYILDKEIFKDYELDKDGLKALLRIITTIFAMRFGKDHKENLILEMFY